MSAVVCPGCGGPTVEVTVRYGSGASMETERHPAWCRACLQQKVVDARTGVCRCSQLPGEHVHTDPPTAEVA